MGEDDCFRGTIMCERRQHQQWWRTIFYSGQDAWPWGCVELPLGWQSTYWLDKELIKINIMLLHITTKVNIGI